MSIIICILSYPNYFFYIFEIIIIIIIIIFYFLFILSYYYTYTQHVYVDIGECGVSSFCGSLSRARFTKFGPVAEMSFTTSLPTVLDALKSKSAPVYAIPLTGQVVGDKGVKFITKSLLKERSFNGIKSLYHPIELCDFSSCALTDRCLNNIAEIVDSIKTLKELKLNSNGFVGNSREAALFFDALSNNTNITSIHLSNNELGGENVMNTIASCLRRNRTAFRSFNLHINPIGDEGLVILSRAFALQRHNIRVVNLSRCDIGDEGFAAFASALKTNKRLMKLFFIIMILVMKECVFVDAMETNKTLTKIDLRHNNI